MKEFDWKNVSVSEVELLPRRTRDRAFSMLWLDWAAETAIATNTSRAFVWIWLVHQARKTKSNTVAMSNEALARYGIGRKIKASALHRMEAAGLVVVERRAGKAVRVTLLKQPGP
jgi:hypothetical protein